MRVTTLLQKNAKLHADGLCVSSSNKHWRWHVHQVSADLSACEQVGYELQQGLAHTAYVPAQVSVLPVPGQPQGCCAVLRCSLLTYAALHYACLCFRGLDGSQERAVIAALATRAAIQPVAADEVEIDQVGGVDQGLICLLAVAQLPCSSYFLLCSGGSF